MGMLSALKGAPGAVVRAAGKGIFALRRAKPQLLVGGGIVIAAGAFVLAIVNARKVDKTAEENSAKIDEIEARKKNIENAVNMTDEEKKAKLKEANRDLNKAKAEGMLKMFTLLGVPTLAFAGGIAMTVGGHVILFRRFGQLSAAFAGLKESYDRYRQAVIAEHGEDADRRYRYGITGDIPGSMKITDENGKEQTVAVKTPVVDIEKTGGLYTFEFSQRTSAKCPRDPVNMISFAKSQQAYWDRFMKTHAVPVTLAMVLDGLGIEWDADDPKNDYILIAGWRPNGDGDNAIDYGILRAVNKPVLDQLSDVLMLDFNCDGNLYHSTRYDKLGRKVC